MSAYPLMLHRTLTLSFLGGAALLGCVSDSGPELGSTEQLVGVIPGGTTCAAQGLGTQELLIQAPQNGVYAVDASNTFRFQYYDDTNTSFFFTQSSIRMNAVLVHSGDNTTVWDIGGANGWPSLGAIIPGGGGYAPTESVSFCFDYKLFLNPNGYANYGTRQEWDITKTGPTGPLILAVGQSYTAEYTVTVTPGEVTPAELFIEGPVFLNNPTPYAPLINDVTVMVGELPAAVTCPVALPFNVPPFSTITCTFTVDVPDTADRVVFVDVASDGLIGVERSVEVASFADHTTSTYLADRCVDVLDEQVPYGYLGTTCASDGVRTYQYSVAIGPFEQCGPFEHANTARFEGLDTGGGESATWVVGGEVPCPTQNCTLTQGYWKTHSEYGPAPYDDTWAQLPAGADTPFFLSGMTYYAVLHQPIQGNAYFTLARQYIAAELNHLRGADYGEAAGAAAGAQILFLLFPPSTSLFKKNTPVRALANVLALVLDAYNNGHIGPGHCDG